MFSGNIFNQPHGPFLFENAASNVMSANTIPAGQEIKVSGSAAAPSSLTINNPATALDIWSGAFSNVTLISSTGEVFFTFRVPLLTQVSTLGSRLTIPGGTKPVLVTPEGMQLHTTSGTVAAWGEAVPGGVALAMNLPAQRPTLSFYLSGFAAGVKNYPVANHRVLLGTVTSLLGTVTADSAGRVNFSDTPRFAGNYLYVAGHVPAAIIYQAYLVVSPFRGCTSGMYLASP